MSRPTRAIINLDALRHNCLLARELAPGSQLVAVVKANAYGHGLLPVARALEPLVQVLAVACSEEALKLRREGVQLPILVLEGPFAESELAVAAQENFWLMLHEPRQVQWILDTDLPHKLKVWLKADTGMHRLGMSERVLLDNLVRLQASRRVQAPVVVATHFAAADQPDSDATLQQWQRFRALTHGLSQPTSVANSATIMAWPQLHGDLVRPGIMLYGSSPFPAGHAQAPQPVINRLRPVMSLKSEVIAVRSVAAGESVGYGRRWTAQRESRIATIAVGYGDGYPRHAPSGTPLLINRQRAPLVGTVSMDMITADVTDLAGVVPGSEVELWGENLSVDEIADHANTIGYELLTRMPARPPRIYLGDSTG